MTNTVNNDHGLIRAQQPLTSFGKIEGKIGVNSLQKEVGRLAVLQVRRQLLEDTAAAYVNLWGAKQRLAIAEVNASEHDRLYQLILRRQQGGIASETDVRLALSRLIQAQAQRGQLRGAVNKANLGLTALTQIPVAADTPVDIALAQVPAADNILALTDNSEAGVLVKLAELEVARKEAELRKSERLPTLYARYERDVTRVTGSAGMDRIGVVLEGSLDGMGVIGAKRVEAANALLQAAQENVADVRSEVRRRVTALMVERETQLQLVQAYERSVTEIEETMHSYLRQYDAGRKTWMDVLNVQKEVTDTRQQLEQARTAWLDSSLRIAAVTGQLDKVAEVKP